MADHSTTDTFRVELPKDLLIEAQRAAKKPTNDQVKLNTGMPRRLRH